MQSIHYFCVKIVKYTDLLVEKCALIHIFFRNDQGVRLLGHVRLSERIQYLEKGNSKQ